MIMRRRKKSSAGMTLVEAMVAITILAIAAVGSLSFQYQVAGHSKIATAQLAATRTAQLLLEDWKSTGASDKYKPSALGLGFSTALSVPSSFSAPSGLGSTLNKAVYAITVDGLPMLVMLQSQNVAQDTVAQVTLRQLSVTVEFGAPSSSDIGKGGSLGEMSDLLSERLKNIPPVTLSTYCRVDASGG